MQIIYQDEDERRSSGRTDIVGFIICVRRIGRYMEEKYFRRFRRRITGVLNGRRILSKD